MKLPLIYFYLHVHIVWEDMIQQPETLVSQMRQSPSRSEQSSINYRSLNRSNISGSSGQSTPKMSPRSATGITTPQNQSYHSPTITPRQESTVSGTSRQSQRSPSDLIVDEVMGLGRAMSPVLSGKSFFLVLSYSSY